MKGQISAWYSYKNLFLNSTILTEDEDNILIYNQLRFRFINWLIDWSINWMVSNFDQITLW